MYVKPNRPTPDVDRGGYLADEGRTVEPNTYWMRRIADGDVTEVDPPPRSADADPLQSPPIAGSSVSEAPVPQPRTARKGAQQ